MTPYFTTTERLNRLDLCARRWLGTPWCANSQVAGARGGVACHLLPRAILVEAEALTANYPQPTGSPTQTRHSKHSFMVDFLNGRSEFEHINPSHQFLRPGDIIGIRICHCVDHLGLMISESQFIHVLMHKLTCLDSITDPTWFQRILDAWRPLQAVAGPEYSI